MSKSKKASYQNLDIDELKKQIIGTFASNPTQPMNYKQVASHLMIKDKAIRQLLGEIMAGLVTDGHLKEIQKGKYKLKHQHGFLTGKVIINESGYGTIESDNFDEELIISGRNLNHAMDGDVVRVRVFPRRKHHYFEGEVTDIIERAHRTFVGVIEMLKNFAFLIPDNKRVPFDLFIPLEHLAGAKNGMKVVGEITDWPRNAKNPFGKVTKILGYPGENDTEIHAILEEFNLPYQFDEDVLAEAESIVEEISESEISRRRDMRDVPTFTIDPFDAKDFDDALSLQKLKNGNWQVGVHIADVTHYLMKKSAMDHEALARGTSVYLVDRVVPMLPEKLSNKVCSLRPNEEKLTFSAIFELTDDAQVMNEWFGRTVIYSDRRFNYEEAQEILDKGEGDMYMQLNTLNILAQKLRDERFAAGSINFERDEVKFDLDANGKPLGVSFKVHQQTNELIEEFMLLANKRVANLIGNVKQGSEAKTFVYRVHDKPDPEKLGSFNAFIAKFGYSIDMQNDRQISNSINRLLKEVEGKNEQNLIETLAIRSMAKAVYSTKNVGHYGLGFKYYTHFTSPIRRYPDVLVHRLLAAYLENEASKNEKKYEHWCRHCSEREKLAADAERSSIKYKQAEYLSERVGEEFDGIISGVTEWGIFVELNENKCEGLVSMRDLDDDFYDFDEENYCLRGSQNGKIYQLGDSVKVMISRINIPKRQIDLQLVD